MNSKLRTGLIAGVSLVAVGAIGTVWATSSAAAQDRYVTAAVGTGEVSQSFLASGTVSRKNLVDADFSVTGTVKKVKVAVGDQVAAGDVLATLDTTALKLTLLNAETDLASAKATLYSAEHPSSSSSGSRGAGSLPSGSSSGSKGSSSGSGTGTSVPSGITATDATKLYQAIAALNVATLNWSNPAEPTTCDLIYTALLNANQQTTDPGEGSGTGQTDPGTGSGSGDSGGTGSGDNGSADPGDSGDNGGSTDPGTSDGTTDPGTSDAGSSGGDNGGADQGSSDAGAPADTGDSSSSDSGSGSGSGDASDSGSTDATTDSGDTEQLALVVDDITVDDIKACGQAREDLLLANAKLTDYYQQLITTGTIDDGTDTPTTPTTPTTPSTPSTPSGGSSGSGKTSSTATVSARAVASAEADVLRAQQAVDAAETALTNAELVAPIAGTVGAVSLAAGESSSGGTVTIVGDGTALVSIEVPLATRTLISQGMPATVTPAGGAASLTGTVSTISVLETSGTAGDNPTYTTVIAVDDPDQALKEGAKAGVEMVTGTASGVLTVPASAVTPTGSGTGTVQVVASASSENAETVTVSTGAVGGGLVEIKDGLTEGQLVVLADRTATIDSLTASTTSNRRSVGFAVPR